MSVTRQLLHCESVYLPSQTERRIYDESKKASEDALLSWHRGKEIGFETENLAARRVFFAFGDEEVVRPICSWRASE